MVSTQAALDLVQQERRRFCFHLPRGQQDVDDIHGQGLAVQEDFCGGQAACFLIALPLLMENPPHHPLHLGEGSLRDAKGGGDPHGKEAQSFGGFMSYLAGDVPSRESPQGRDGRGRDGSGTFLCVLQEDGDGLGQHRVPQGQQVDHCLGLLLGTPQPCEDGFNATLHLLVGFGRGAEAKEDEERAGRCFGKPWGVLGSGEDEVLQGPPAARAAAAGTACPPRSPGQPPPSPAPRGPAASHPACPGC